MKNKNKYTFPWLTREEYYNKPGKHVVLKRCPICDSVPEIIPEYELVKCVNDDCVLGGIARPLSAWNKRPAEQKVLAVVDEIRDALRMAQACYQMDAYSAMFDSVVSADNILSILEDSI